MSKLVSIKLDGVKISFRADTMASDKNIGTMSTFVQFHKDGESVFEMEYLWISRNAHAVEESMAIFLNSKGDLLGEEK